ncbi:MAG TPA: hypothetical protein VM452_19860 [Caulifigura sp.]|nr:hypothetical protein [Caulifigura sp.]
MSLRITRGVVVGSAVCSAVSLFAVLSVGWADTPAKKPGGRSAPVLDSFAPATGVSSTTAPGSSIEPVPTPRDPKSSKSNRIMFEASWKNVHIGSKTMHFRQGDRPHVWTVRNTGANPVVLGDDYGFSVDPGEEEFIVDTRLVLFVADDKSTTVEVSASRVMTLGELTVSAEPTPADGPTPTYSDTPSKSKAIKGNRQEESFKSL